MNKNLHTTHDQDGVTLLVALLLVGVLLGVSTSLLNITLKQYQLSGIALASEMAFQAANAGMECALYNDYPISNPSKFEVLGDGTEQTADVQIDCFGLSYTSDDRKNGTLHPYGDVANNHRAVSGEEQHFTFNWGSPAVCIDVSVYKFFSDSGPVERWVNDEAIGPTCSKSSVCTIIQSRGYNVDCASVTAGTNPRIVEREYTQVY